VTATVVEHHLTLKRKASGSLTAGTEPAPKALTAAPMMASAADQMGLQVGAPRRQRSKRLLAAFGFD